MGNKPTSSPPTIQRLQRPATVQRSHSTGPPRISRRCSEFKSKVESPATERPQISNHLADPNRASRRRWSSAAVVNARNNTVKPKRIAPRQRNLIIKSWSRLPKNKIGKDIFTAIFTEAEELKRVFGIPEHIRGKKLRQYPRFVAHTDLFVDTFDFVIRNLDDISMVTENAEQLGRRHSSFNIENFRPEYWGIFTECTLEVVSNNEDKETQIAWRQLLQTLTFYMKLGFERESLQAVRITRQASMRQPLTPTRYSPDIFVP